MAAADPRTLDLGELEFDVDDGVELARWVDRIRARVRSDGRVVVRRCPQMLAHTLYKAGLLRDGRIELIETREEEPYG
jgi:hypothetical protein